MLRRKLFSARDRTVRKKNSRTSGNFQADFTNRFGNHRGCAPADTSYSVCTFWNKDHIAIICGGSNVSYTGMALVGGGDHGGPTRAKMKLPKNRDSLVAKYAAEPHYA